jgi:FkbM family methyltransferase
MKMPKQIIWLPKVCLRFLADMALLSRGTKLPPYFNWRHRLSYLYQGLEPSVVRVATGILRRGDSAVDIGANVGFLTRKFAAMVSRSGRVYAFEPDPATFAYLTYNTRRLPQVERFDAAISDRNETTALYLHPTSAMSNSLVNAWEHARSINVKTFTFDEWAASNNLGHIALIKIDVEGAEPLVLRGMLKTLSLPHKPQLIAEFCPANLGSRAAEEEIFELLSDHGYRMHCISSEGKLHLVNTPTDLYQRLNENGYVNLLARAATI